jgi:hypothetical protein
MNNFTLLLVFLWVFSASLAVAQSDPCTLLANAQLRGGTRVWVGNTSRLSFISKTFFILEIVWF